MTYHCRMASTASRHDAPGRASWIKAGLIATSIAALSAPAQLMDRAQAATPERANVIVILADDLGYGDLSAYGSTRDRTPNIDALAAGGVRFTNGYVTHPVCAPSRAGLLTGRYQERFGYEFNPRGRDAREGVSLSEIMLPKVMKQAGYATGMVGKWHQGQPGPYYPNARGFDSYFGMAGGGSVYIIDPKPGDEFIGGGSEEEIGDLARARPDDVAAPSAKRLEAGRARAPISRDGVTVREADYLTDAFTREGLDFIDRHKGGPFFLYMAYNAPHVPLQVTKKYYDRFPEIARKDQRIYAAMVSALDDGVGAIEAKLKADKLDKNTLVIFLSDNGCPDYVHGACSNAPLIGFKRTHFEGGVRVPYIVSWPGHVPAGRVDDRTVSSLDIFPTAVAVAHGKLPTDRAYDGVDLTPFLTGRRSGVPNPTLYWRAGPTFAIRDGDWKMLLVNKAPPGAKAGNGATAAVAASDPTTQPPYPAAFGQHAMLYDLKASPTETHNLAAGQPSVTARLKAKLAAWNKRLGVPQWPSLVQAFETYDGVLIHTYD
ncbi:sulfatase-like hydrolase/transferase [Phenylobacterium sp.]|jgi:arylsulfatase B|uniref:sulfatase-like hydrolase/transferase n=1 Tax=Phenylobacterium sp. TaxID=1871053 RepID=UPI002F41C2CB